MSVLSVVSTVALVALAGAVGFIAGRRTASVRHGPAHARIEGPPEVDLVIAGPPQVRGDSVRDWLMHYTYGRYSWGDAVAEFYRRAADDPEIASYFHDVDMPALQRHFTAAIGIVTSKGVTTRTVLRMAQVHADVRDRGGRPITGEVYDRTVGVLVEVLADMGVPPAAVADLAEVVAPLRRAIAVDIPADGR